MHKHQIKGNTNNKNICKIHVFSKKNTMKAMIFSNKSNKQIEYLHIMYRSSKKRNKNNPIDYFLAKYQRCYFIIFHSYYFFTTPQNTFYAQQKF